MGAFNFLDLLPNNVQSVSRRRFHEIVHSLRSMAQNRKIAHVRLRTIRKQINIQIEYPAGISFPKHKNTSLHPLRFQRLALNSRCNFFFSIYVPKKLCVLLFVFRAPKISTMVCRKRRKFTGNVNWKGTITPT